MLWQGWVLRISEQPGVCVCEILTRCVLMEFRPLTVQSTSGSGDPDPLQLTVALSPSITSTLLWLTLISGKSANTQTHTRTDKHTLNVTGMSHQQEIILQSLQPLSDSTHSFSNQIHPLNSVTPPPPPASTHPPSLLFFYFTFNPPFSLLRFPSSHPTCSTFHFPPSPQPPHTLLFSLLFLFLKADQPPSLPYHSCGCTCCAVASSRLRSCSTAAACGARPLLSAATAGSSGYHNRSRTPHHPDAFENKRQSQRVNNESNNKQTVQSP